MRRIVTALRDCKRAGSWLYVDSAETDGRRRQFVLISRWLIGEHKQPPESRRWRASDPSWQEARRRRTTLHNQPLPFDCEKAIPKLETTKVELGRATRSVGCEWVGVDPEIRRQTRRREGVETRLTSKDQRDVSQKTDDCPWGAGILLFPGPELIRSNRSTRKKRAAAAPAVWRRVEEAFFLFFFFLSTISPARPLA
jgi:hypothetical protein